MNDQTDSQLLNAWAKTRSEPAFAELVRRHVDLVHSAAMRMVSDAHLAEDVTQRVFVALAKSAAQITDCRVLAGWLHRTAQNIAAETVRTDVRRRAREQEAVVMNQLLATESDAPWEHIAPHLDAALGELSGSSRWIRRVTKGQAPQTSWLSGPTSPISRLPSRSVPSYLWIDSLTSRINRPATRESPSTRPASRSSGPINHSSGPTSQLSVWISRLTSRSMPLSARIRRVTSRFHSSKTIQKQPKAQ